MPRIAYLPQHHAEPEELVAAIRQRRGGELPNLDRMLLQSHWNGEFAALWVGDTPAVPAEAEIIAFQNARGLPADGVAGPLTLMALAGDAPGPRLLRVLE